ncbi:MAG: hypothetical protein ABIH20_03370 [Candidatus Diapherotrites archaeon]
MKPLVKKFFQGLMGDFLIAIGLVIGYAIAFFLLIFAIMLMHQYIGPDFVFIFWPVLLLLPILAVFLIFKFITNSWFRGLALIAISLELFLTKIMFGVTSEGLGATISDAVSYVMVGIFFLAGLLYLLSAIFKFLKFSVGSNK